MDKHPAVVSFATNAANAFTSALELMAHEGVAPAKITQFAKEHGFSVPDAPMIQGESGGTALSRRADRLVRGIRGMSG
jgi:hypothetical protein